MQQLTDIVLDFKAFLRDGNRAFIPFRLRIREPRLDEAIGLYFCIVDCPALKLTDFRVPGDNGNQACGVANGIVRAHLDAPRYALTDGNGDPVTVPDVPVTWQMSTMRFRPKGLPPRPVLFKTDGILLNFEAFIQDRKDATGKAIPFSLRVSHPVMDAEGGHYTCETECPFLRAAPYRIPGADDAQACALAVSFIGLMLKDTDFTLVDRDGNPVSLPEVPVSWPDSDSESG